MILYIDDLLIANNDKAEKWKLKRSLHEKFSMKELGEAQHMLGMRIEQNWTKKTLRLSQSDYIRKVLKCFNMEHAKPGLTPLPMSFRLSNIYSPSIRRRNCSCGKYPTLRPWEVSWAMVVTQPDLANVIGVIN